MERVLGFCEVGEGKGAAAESDEEEEEGGDGVFHGGGGGKVEDVMTWLEFMRRAADGIYTLSSARY